jgi:uncharacterized membrane protein YkoI
MNRAHLSLLVILCCTSLAGPSLADSDRDTARELRQAGTILPLETILDKARAIQPGQVLEVEFKRKDERYLYEIEILDARGTVHELYLDAHNGDLLKVKKDD